jgi:hypothetical protein
MRYLIVCIFIYKNIIIIYKMVCLSTTLNATQSTIKTHTHKLKKKQQQQEQQFHRSIDFYLFNKHIYFTLIKFIFLFYFT